GAPVGAGRSGPQSADAAAGWHPGARRCDHPRKWSTHLHPRRSKIARSVTVLSFEPNPQQKSALRELARAGASEAANALSRLLGSAVTLEEPQVQRATGPEIAQLLGGELAPVNAVTLEFSGAFTGQLLLVLDEGEALALASALTGMEPEQPEVELALPAVAEVANILGARCLNARVLHGRAVAPPAPPVRHGAPVRELLAGPLGRRLSAGGAVLAWARLRTDKSPTLSARLFAIPDPATLPGLVTRLGA